MNRMRSLPLIMGTLEKKIEQDREKLQRIRNDLLYEQTQRGKLAWDERTLMAKIERNVGKRELLRLENMELRQKFLERIS